MSKIKNMKKYNYFYKITNNLNNHFYYGIHSTNDLEDGYMGSGTRLHYAYKKYGIENFTKEIIKFFDTRKECAEYEAEMVTEELVHSKECYNVSCGGDVFNTIGTISVRDKDGKCFRCSQYDENYLNGNYIPVAKGLVFAVDINTNKNISITSDEYYSNKDKYIAGTHSICVKRKDNLNEDYFYITEEEYKNNKDLYINKQSEYVLVKYKNDPLQKTYFVHKKDERYLSGKMIPIWCGKKHKKETIEKVKKTLKEIKHQQGEKNSQYGTCWVMKDNENKKIKKEELDTYIQMGWIKGRKIKKSS